jgi:hypothetical protein
MKSASLLLPATALLGFAGGWLLKPAPPVAARPAAATGDADRSTPAASAKSRDREPRDLVLKRRGGPAEVDAGELGTDPERAAAEIDFERGFQNAADRTEKARLVRLAEALGLSPEQQATMEVLLANRRDGFRDIQQTSKSPAEMLEQAARAERGFEEQVAKLLDPEQAAALAALRERQRDNEVEARAQRDLADLIDLVDLSPEQRDQALAALRGGSAEAVAKRPAGWSVMNESLDVLGGRSASVFDQMGDFMADPEALRDPGEIHRRLIESQRQATDRKLRELAAVLTPGQLAQYRATLEARSGFMEQFTPPSSR